LPPFPGALPPNLMGAPAGAGPGVAPHGNAGNAAGGLSKIKMALKMLQEGLPDVPMGSPLHDAVMKSITTIGKHMTEAQESQQGQMQALLQMIAKMKQAQPGAALGAMGAPPPGGAPAPPAMPAMAPPPPAPGAPPG